MKRGEIWTVSGGPDYAGKPRPSVIVQDESFEDTTSATLCLLTTGAADVPMVRPLVQPSEQNRLIHPCRLMVDKITTVSRSKLGRRIGRLDVEDMMRLNQALILFLGLASSPRAERGPESTS